MRELNNAEQKTLTGGMLGSAGLASDLPASVVAAIMASLGNLGPGTVVFNSGLSGISVGPGLLIGVDLALAGPTPWQC